MTWKLKFSDVTLNFCLSGRWQLHTHTWRMGKMKKYEGLLTFRVGIEATWVPRNITCKAAAHTLQRGFVDLGLSGLFSTLVAFPSCPDKVDYLCSHQCWSIPCQNDGNLARNFLWCSARRHPSLFCPFPHIESVPSISSVQRSFNHFTHNMSLMKG